jgi:class 3 adenylate cyclase/tetratricopeptide (TPR) repeat protein
VIWWSTGSGEDDDVNCGTCGRTLQVGDAFCGGCGTKVQAAPRADDAERRQLTLLFYDLVGSTQLSTVVDAEDLQVVIGRYQDLCTRTVREVGGFPANTMGDGGLVYFGYPVAHEDDPFRAVLAAQAILDELPELNRSIRSEIRSFPTDLQVRIGIHSGTVVIGEEGSDRGAGRLAIGEALNLAARIESVAPPNGIAVSAVTARRIQGVVDLTSLGRSELKGIAEPVEVFRVDRIRPGQTRFTSVRVLGPFVGRDREADQLRARWEAASAGSPATVVIRGDAGLGKSRLLQHLRHTLTGVRHAWFELYGSPVMSQSAFHPIIQMLHQLLGLDDLSDAERRARLVVALEDAELADPERIEHLAGLLGIEQTQPSRLSRDEQRAATIAAVCDWLLAIAARMPTVLVAEDLHWFDPSTLEVLAELRSRVEGRAVLILGTTRPTAEAVWGDDVEVIDLEPLPLTDVSALVDRLAEQGQLSALSRAKIASRCDGVPLFAEELVQAALDTDDGVEAVPETLRELMSARLDRLGEAKEVLQLAALLGREFPRSQLAAVAEVGDLDATLEVLVEQNFIARRSSGERAVFLFRHALLQDAARDSMLRRRREAEHRRIARLLLESFSGTLDGRPEIVGHHFAEGAEPALAIEQFRLAAAEALERAALREGAAYLTRSIEVLSAVEASSERDELEVELHLQLGSALALSDGMMSPRATEVHTTSVELCRRTDPPHPLLGNALTGVLQSHLSSGDFDRALEVGEELLAWAEATGERVAELAAHAALCQVHFWPGRYVDCWRHATRAWELYDPTDPIEDRYAVGIDSGVTALVFGAVGSWATGRLEESLQRADHALELARQQPDLYQIAFASAYLSMHAVMHNDPQRCQALASAGQALAAQHGFLPMEGLSTFMLGWALADLGDPSGLDCSRAGFNQLAGLGVGMGAPGCMAVLAEMCAKAGELDEGFGLAALGEAMADESGQHFYSVEIYRSMALLHLAQAQTVTQEAVDEALAAAEASARRSVEVARSQQAPSLELRAVQPLVTILEARGDHGEARELLAGVVAKFAPTSRGADLDRARAELARPAAHQRR